MTLSANGLTYEWQGDWAELPDNASTRENGRTHGVVVARDGRVVVFRQSDPAVHLYDGNGKLLEAWGSEWLGAHGLTLVDHEGEDALWLTDEHSAAVAKFTLDGREILRLERPDIPAYENAAYKPTWAAEYEVSKGGNGDIWVADGYGTNLVHRYDAAGKYLGSIDGSEGAAGPFACPHGIAVDYAPGGARLLIADRGNRRFQVYSLDGKYQETFGADYLHSPDMSARWGEYLVVPELLGGVALIDGAHKLVGKLGEKEKVNEQPGWPNVDASLLREGYFNSPHGAVADQDGNIYVVEWILGGRVTKLARA